MRIFVALIRLALAVVLGQFLLVVPMAVAQVFGMHGWAFMHSGLPFLLFPLCVWLAHWLLGFVPVFKRGRTAPPGATEAQSPEQRSASGPPREA